MENPDEPANELTYVVELLLDGPFGIITVQSGLMRASEGAMTSTAYKPGVPITCLVRQVRLKKLRTEK